MEFWFPLGMGLFVIALLGGVGAAVRFGKAYWLISGYNMMPEEKRMQVDAEGLGRFIGNSLFIGCGVIAVSVLFFLLGLWIVGLAVLFLLLPGVVFLLVGAQRYDRNALTTGGKLNRKTRIVIGIVVLSMAAVAVLVGILLNGSATPAKFNVTFDSLEIKSAFGDTVPLADIAGLELVEALPEISLRTNGSAIGDVLRGSFRLADGASARIFIENARPPFVHFTCGAWNYYINCATAAETQALYDTLNQAVQK